MSGDDQLEEERIAIIGMAGRFPGARTVAELWENLCTGVDSIRSFDDAELRARGVPEALLADPNYVKAGAVLDDVEMFDAAFFGISPREAALMDPQHRLFLQACWEALEDAGHMTDRGPLAAGVFAGSGPNGYLAVPGSWPGGDQALEYVRAMGNEKDYLASRVAYHLNLTGPALVVQTTCSTSLVAVHIACQNLLTYQCDLALAGGVATLLPQGLGHLYQEGMPLSPDGRCRTFDARAQGYVNGRGLGVVVLKRLSEALEDGDRIDAVILGSAVNNDGALKVGFTALSVDGQADVVAAALAVADVHPETIRYLEAFGGATPLGDSIEVEALTRAFRAQTDATGFCRIGSIKTNIGHLDVAAGVAGLIKTALVLKTGEVPPNLHFETPNPVIDFASTPFVVATDRARLERGPDPLRAGVSSFGVGGTNVHAILEEPPDLDDADPSQELDVPALLVLSAKTPEALEQTSLRLAHHLEALADVDLDDVAWTLQVGRRHLARRRMLLGRTAAEVIAELRQPWTPPLTVRSDRAVLYLLPGGAPAEFAAALDLYRREPVFQEAFEQAADDARRMGWPDPLAALTSAASDLDARAADVLLFTLQRALAEFWIAAGLPPTALVGEGTGLLVAACLADMIALQDALSILEARSRFGDPEAALEHVATRLGELALRPAKIPVAAARDNLPVEDLRGLLAEAMQAPDGPGAALALVRGRPERVVLTIGPPAAEPEYGDGANPDGGVVLPSLPLGGSAEVDAPRHIRHVLGQLWLAGLGPDFRALHHGQRRRRVGLPTYPFARTPHWLETGPGARPDADAPASRAATLGRPEDTIERTLRAIFKDVLGVPNVAVDDDFFRLGGDSLMALSVAARARAAGLHLAPRQIVETPTIAGLARVAARRPAATPTVHAGEVPLTPFLARFLKERGEHDPHRWNISALTRARRRLQPALLERTVAALFERHDALRLRVVRRAGGWAAEALPTVAVGDAFEVVDLAALSDAELPGAIEARAEQAQRGLHLGDGPIIKVVLFELGPARAQRLLVVVHHFAVDGFAWVVLLDHLEETYTALESGREPLPAPAAGMKSWADGLRRFAEADGRERDIQEWLALPWSEIRPLPLDHPGGRAMNTNASAAAIVHGLSHEETERLLRVTSSGFQPETLMISALAVALARFQGNRHVLIERLFQGRNVADPTLDLSVSLGSFLCYAPCPLAIDPDAPCLDIVRRVGEQLKGVAGRGAAIDLVRFMAVDRPAAGGLGSLPRAEVLFNYRGKVDGLLEHSELLSLAPESAGSDYDPEGRRYHPLAVRADLVARRLDLRVVYSRNLHDQPTVQRLADDLLTFIRSAVDAIHDHG